MYSQGYIPTQPHSSTTKKPKKNIKKVLYFTGSFIAVIIITILVTSSGLLKPTPDAGTIAYTYLSAGYPLSSIQIYNAQTDPNNLLGRPGSYTSKASFADDRVDQAGGSIEVFSNAQDAKSRYDYVSAFNGSILGSYCYLQDKVFLRLDYSLTPDIAAQYESALPKMIDKAK